MTIRQILLLAIATPLLAAADAGEKTAMRAKLADEIRKHVAYVPAPPAAPAGELLPAPDTDVVVLAPFVMTTASDAFAHKIDEQQAKEKRERFNLTDGGTLWKVEGKAITAEIKIRYDPTHDGLTSRSSGWDLLSLSW